MEMEDEQFLIVAPSVPWWDHRRLDLAYRMLRRQWVPRVIVEGKENDPETLVTKVSVTKLAVRSATSPMEILQHVAGEVVRQLQYQMGLEFASQFKRKRR